MPNAAKVIMVQGTMSNAGKSIVVAGLCRLFRHEGLRVAPFKSQNMALNSFVTMEGLEIGRAQAMQAEASGLDPTVDMNPILLKPTGDSVSQVIVNGKSIGNMTAREYFSYKTSLIPEINKAFRNLSMEYDLVVIEGAGSPAEINLRQRDIVNMGLADMIDAPVILIGDIDRGGVFAQLYGTYMLLSPRERELLKGVVINKFRGDKTLLNPGIEMMKDKMDVPFVGVIPYMEFNLEDEDSLSRRFEKKKPGRIDIVGIKLPRISNYTDLDVFQQYKDVSVRYVDSKEEIGTPDLIVIPGSKNTISDLRWLKESGLGETIKIKAKEGIPIAGICGGFQMLGEEVKDPDCVEEGGDEQGLGLLPVKTILGREKTTKQYQGLAVCGGKKENVADSIFGFLCDTPTKGYEIHMGVTNSRENQGIIGYMTKNVLGTYVHGIFDEGEIAKRLILELSRKKGIDVEVSNSLGRREYKEKEYDRLADVLRINMNMEAIYEVLREGRLDWEY